MRDAIATKGSRRLMLVAVGLLAAVAVLPLLVPPSAVSYPPGLTATEISSAKVCGASECREVSDPEAATALAVGPRPRGTDAPERGLPWYKSTLTIRAEDGGEVDRVSVTVVPSAGLMRWEDGVTWVTLPSESKEAYAKLTAGLTPRPARTLPGPGEDAKLPAARVDEVVEPPSAATPATASDGSNVWIVALGGGVLAALMAGLLLRIRHRRASTPPAAPEASG
jgi:LPXTG-motif cell wall-anchored protein